jgi:hypothetical protein
MSDMFTFRDTLEPTGDNALPSEAGGGAGRQGTPDLVNFDVEASDGSVGKVLDATYEAGESCLIVQTGSTLLGRRVVLPAGVIDRIDHDGKTIHVGRTKDEIKGAPEFDEERYREAHYREQLSGYYGR